MLIAWKLEQQQQENSAVLKSRGECSITRLNVATRDGHLQGGFYRRIMKDETAGRRLNAIRSKSNNYFAGISFSSSVSSVRNDLRFRCELAHPESVDR